VTAAREQFQDFLTEVEENETLESKATQFAEQQNRTLRDVRDAHLLPVENMVHVRNVWEKERRNGGREGRGGREEEVVVDV
jgi:hypothetical protein